MDFPLITKKKADFLLFKQVIEIIGRNEHITLEGLQQILNIKASINLGLSDTLKTAFSNTKPVPRPIIQFTGIPDPNWLCDFVEAEGCFMVQIQKSTSHKQGVQVKLGFSIGQHFRDIELLESLIVYLSCGRMILRSRKENQEYCVTKITDITDKIFPFFDKYPLLGAKALDLTDFKKAAVIISSKGHLTNEGLEQIRLIKSRMNSARLSCIKGNEENDV
jgi:hypothetical protein